MTEFLTLPPIMGSEESREEILIYRHSTNLAVLNNKVLLQKNMFSLIMSGTKILSYADKSTAISDRQFALLSPGYCLMTEKLSAYLDYSSLLFFFDNKVLVRFFFKYASLVSRLKAEYKSTAEPFIILDKDLFIENYITSLNLMIQYNTKPSLEMKQLKFEELMLHLLNKYPQAILSFQSDADYDNNDLQLQKVVQTNMFNNVTIDELAFLCNSSLSTFKRRFAKVYNTSPSQYFLKCRLEKAARLLLDNNENPSNIYYQVGYENLSSFSQSFKQLFGISPKHYKQKKLNV